MSEPNPISQSEYEHQFKFDTRNGESEQRATSLKREEALEHALDIRKFEIDNYWRRSNYFWALIAVALAGYAAIHGMEHLDAKDKSHLICVVSSLGFVLSVAWHLANRGSKQWQENWENHVDLLEDAVTGPLYKTVLGRPKPRGKKESFSRIVSGPGPYSVSKLNQIVSCFSVLLWVVLFGSSLNLGEGKPDGFKITLAAITALATGMLMRMGRTDNENHTYRATLRKSVIKADVEEA